MDRNRHIMLCCSSGPLVSVEKGMSECLCHYIPTILYSLSSNTKDQKLLQSLFSGLDSFETLPGCLLGSKG